MTVSLNESAGMGIASGTPEPLKGLPVHQGKHIRFDDEGQEVLVSPRLQLRGVPVAKGQHIRFD